MPKIGRDVWGEKKSQLLMREQRMQKMIERFNGVENGSNELYRFNLFYF